MSNLDQLIRAFNSDPNNHGNNNRLILELLRSGSLDEQMLTILGLSGNSIAEQMISINRPPLYIVAGFQDPLDLREASRITFMSQFKKTFHIELWIDIIINLLENFANTIFQNKYKRKFGYLVRNEEERTPNLQSQLQYESERIGLDLLQQDVYDALNYLKANNYEEFQISRFEQKFQDWALLLTEDYIMEYFNWDLGEVAQRKQDYYARALYNLVEMINYMLKVNLGSLGEPYQVNEEYNPRYTGSPFLFYWRNRYASLNPRHHLNMGHTTRLNLSYNDNGTINSSVVLSNLLTGCYLIYGFLLGLSSKNLDLYKMGKTRLSRSDQERINNLEGTIDELQEAISEIRYYLKETQPAYLSATNEWTTINDPDNQAQYVNMTDDMINDILDAQDQRLQEVENIIDSFEGDTDIPQLEERAQELADEVSDIEDAPKIKYSDKIDEKITKKFWKFFQKAIPDSFIVSKVL